MVEIGAASSKEMMPSIIYVALYIGLNFRLWRFNETLRLQGIGADMIYPGIVGLIFVVPIYGLNSLFGLFLIGVCFWSFGWWSLFIFPLAAIFGRILVFIGFIPKAQYIIPISALVMALMIFDWFSLLNWDPARPFNKAIYDLFV